MPDDADTTLQPAKKKRVPKTLVIVAAVAIGEAGMFFGALKMFGGGPQTSYGDENGHFADGDEAEANPGMAEVVIVKKLKVPNSETGRTFIHDFDVIVKVIASRSEEVQKLVEERSGEINDRIAQIVRAADLRDLEEPDMATIKLKFKTAIGEILKDGELIRQVLIPRWVPMQSG